MYKNICLSKYNDIASSLHVLNPIIKIICLIMFTVVTLIQKELAFIGILSILLMILILMSNINLRVLLNEVNKVKYVLLLVFVINALAKLSIEQNMVIILKILLILIYYSLFILTTGAKRLASAFNILFRPLKIFGVKVYSLSVKAVLVITYLPSLLDESMRIIKTISIRGLDYMTGSLIDKFKIIKLAFIPTFKMSFKRSMIDKKLDIRLYNPSVSRKSYRTLGICYDDFVILSTHVLIIAAIIIKEVIL